MRNLDALETHKLTPREKSQLARMLQRVRDPGQGIHDILNKVPGDSIAAKARRVGVARWTWYKWLAGDFRPSGKHAARIARLTNVPLHQITGDQP